MEGGTTKDENGSLEFSKEPRVFEGEVDACGSDPCPQEYPQIYRSPGA